MIGDGTFGRPHTAFPLPDFEEHVCGRVLSAAWRVFCTSLCIWCLLLLPCMLLFSCLLYWLLFLACSSSISFCSCFSWDLAIVVGISCGAEATNQTYHKQTNTNYYNNKVVYKHPRIRLVTVPLGTHTTPFHYLILKNMYVEGFFQPPEGYFAPRFAYYYYHHHDHYCYCYGYCYCQCCYYYCLLLLLLAAATTPAWQIKMWCTNISTYDWWRYLWRPHNAFPLPDFEEHVCGRVLSAAWRVFSRFALRVFVVVVAMVAVVFVLVFMAVALSLCLLFF